MSWVFRLALAFSMRHAVRVVMRIFWLKRGFASTGSTILASSLRLRESGAPAHRSTTGAPTYGVFQLDGPVDSTEW